jgi:hypothetical protein
MTAASAVTDVITTQQYAVLGALGLIVLVFLATRGSRRVRDGSPKQYRREIDSATEQSEEVKRSMEQLLAALEELSGKIGAQVDESLAKLRKTTEEADRRISAMRILIAESKRLASESTGAPATGQVERTPRGEALPEPPAAAPILPEPPQARSSGEPSATPEPRHQRVYELADRGLTAVQIAQELQTQPGEIELILNLRGVEA